MEASKCRCGGTPHLQVSTLGVKVECEECHQFQVMMFGTIDGVIKKWNRMNKEKK